MANKKEEQNFVNSLVTQYNGKLNFFAHDVHKNPDVGFNCTINGQSYSFF